tara:strand:+ start:276 stop:428 length:153 start_codon:yes stop_codon:yes gene_type:complete
MMVLELGATRSWLLGPKPESFDANVTRDLAESYHYQWLGTSFIIGATEYF